MPGSDGGSEWCAGLWRLRMVLMAVVVEEAEADGRVGRWQVVCKGVTGAELKQDVKIE